MYKNECVMLMGKRETQLTSNNDKIPSRAPPYSKSIQNYRRNYIFFKHVRSGDCWRTQAFGIVLRLSILILDLR